MVGPTMFFLDLTLPTLAENLALDEALLLDAEEGGPSLLRVWNWSHFAVVLGAGGKVAEDVDETACRADQVPLLRRSSGGGTVLLGPGCLLYSLILPYDSHPACKDVNASYRHILGEMAAALADLAPGITCAGTSDLASGDRKFSGNSQQRKRTHFLHHGTLLYAFDLAKIPRYLKNPARQPDYRQDRDHLAFLMNLPADPAELGQRLRLRWRALEPLESWPRHKVRELVAEKYGREDWTQRR
jgi:lipoate-protein ligase A